MALQATDPSDRVRELEAQNQSLLLEIEKLRAVNARQAHLIETHEFLGGRLFTCFPRLPAELRHRIWQLSTSPRVISVLEDWDEDEPKEEKKWLARITDREVRAPTTSRVCKESRDVFQSEYFLLVACHQGHCGLPIYVNPLIDTIYLSSIGDNWREIISSFSQHLKKYLNQEQAGNIKKWGIRNLALDQESLRWFTHQPLELAVLDEEFPALENLVFLVKKRSGIRWRVRITSSISTELAPLWEKQMKRVGLLKAMARHCKLSKWEELRVTIAAKVPTSMDDFDYHVPIDVIDERNGFDMFGPAGEHHLWSERAEAFLKEAAAAQAGT